MQFQKANSLHYLHFPKYLIYFSQYLKKQYNQSQQKLQQELLQKNMQKYDAFGIYPPVKRLVAIGDLHGDLIATFKVLKLAENLGLKNFDTAPLYSKGYSELLIGEAFKGNKKINVTTKIGSYKIDYLSR